MLGTKVCSFESESLRSSSRTVSARLAAGIFYAGSTANLLAKAFRQTSHIIAVYVILFILEAKQRVVLAGSIIRAWCTAAAGI